jgi:branched-subunit amino acid aminotransferase/4-amino-4-deoxychorismate lyase
MDNFIFFNGKITLLSKTFISINDRGFLYGDGFFETIRSYKDNFYDFEYHYNRILKTAKFLNIEMDFKKEYLIENIRKLKEANKLMGRDCYCRITITRGTDPYGPSIKKDPTPPTVVMEVKPLPKYVIDKASKGVETTILYSFKKEKNILYNFKTLNYLPSIIGFLNRKSYDDVIFIDRNDNLIEGITANLFFYKGKMLYTSNEDDLFLKGVTRDILIKAIKRYSNEGFRISYRNFKFNDLKKIDGAFFTNSLSGIYPIISIEDFKLKHRPNIIAKLKNVYFRFLTE